MAYIDVRFRYSAVLGVGCQSPGNCKKHRRFGGDAPSTDIKHVQRRGSRVGPRDFPRNFRFPADQRRRVHPVTGQLINFKMLPLFNDTMSTIEYHIIVKYCICVFIYAYIHYVMIDPYFRLCITITIII